MSKSVGGFAVLLALACGAVAAPSRILILAGPGKHDTRSTAPYLASLLEKTGRYEVRTNEETAGIRPDTLSGYDAVVLIGAGLPDSVRASVRSGKGAVVLHAGQGCGARALYRVERRGNHPVMDGAADFRVSDRLSTGFVDENMTLVAVTGRAETPVGWTYSVGKGRVFQTVLGHDRMAMEEPGFAAMFVRAVDWAASGTVQRVTPSKPVRALVVTGGHSYEPSFYTVFEGVPWLEWTHEENRVLEKSFAERFDVLVFYNMTNEISEKAKENLRAWVESGRGTVVLHHAIYNYQNWPWWFDVTGARPLPPERKLPGPGYLHDVELVVESAGEHPITEGLTPMHLVDETYKGLEWSREARVLLRTDHQTSDGPVAWLGPNPAYRVVTVQLGHDHQSHLRADFRTLVERAIRWSVGQL